MSNDLRREYYRKMSERYKKADKGIRSYLLDEMVEMTGHHRKYIIRRMHRLIRGTENKNKPGRKPYYSESSRFHIKKLWPFMKQMCSKKMKASLPFWLVYYKAPDFTDSVKKEILKMSHSTIDRILKPQRTQYGRRLRTGTKRNENWVENVIPVKALNFESDRPGMLQADTIAHCGGSMSGIFTWSLAMTDICSGWTCTRAMWNKTANSTFFALRKVEQLLPFKIAGFNVDNGTEFINAQLVYYAQRHPNGSLRENPLEITRSRAYRKNDNCYVEQKNFTHVREIFGYERFEFESLLEAMNEIYELDNDLQNFFVPQMKLIFKERIKSKYKKKYDKPQTPYRRILHSEFVSEEIKNTLRKKYQELNPFELTSLIEKKKKSFFEEYYKLTQCVARGSGYG